MAAGKVLNDEFFNLYIEYKAVSSGEYVVESEQLVAGTKDDIQRYFRFIQKGEFGEHQIGRRKVNVVLPESHFIYNFSKLGSDLQLNSKQDYINLVQKSFVREKNYKRVFENLGNDVTDLFGTLPNYLGSPTTTTTTSTTTTTTTTEIPQESNIINPFIPNEFLGGIIDNSAVPIFNVKQIAKVFANQLKALKHENGQMVGIFGKWGRGKTYFVNEVCKILKINFQSEKSEEDSDFIFIKFQAWKYQTTPSTWAYLFETIIDKYLDVDWYNKPRRIISFTLIRKGHWNSWVKPLLGILLCAIWFILVPLLTQNATIIEVGKWTGGIGAMLIITNKIASILKLLNKPAIKLFDSLTKIPSFKSVLGIQAEVQKELVYLIRTWAKRMNKKKWDWKKWKSVEQSHKRLLLFIDDLDRCSEDSMIEIIDALRVILDDAEINKNIIVLIAVDDDKLKKAIEFKYKERRNKDELKEISKEYIDKLFISALKLPPISSDNYGKFIQAIANQVNFPKGKNIEVQIDDQNNLSVEVDLDETLSNANDAEEADQSKMPETKIESNIELTENEIDILKGRISSINFELTPRQIRIIELGI